MHAHLHHPAGLAVALATADATTSALRTLVAVLAVLDLVVAAYVILTRRSGICTRRSLWALITVNLTLSTAVVVQQLVLP
ncbi:MULTISPECIES: hypothetical protein [Kitasatospora]|uniref:hypothetical protein n=1 Tax=Kitasatospora TaxID=2063 RepID=UPI0004BFC9D9|nr:MULTISPECIES: hypothetical protein [Kitasatospora]